MPVHAVLSRSGKKDGEGLRTEEIVMIEEKMEEKKVQLDKVRRAFRNPNLRAWMKRARNRKSGLRSKGTAGALCVYCDGSFPGHHQER